MEWPDIQEFRTNWNNELFFKKRSTCLAARRLIRKSVAIVKARQYRRLKLLEEDLTVQLQTAEKDRQLLTEYSRSGALATHLQQRLQALHDEIKTYSQQVKKIMQKEKDYWKDLEQAITKRAKIIQRN